MNRLGKRCNVLEPGRLAVCFGSLLLLAVMAAVCVSGGLPELSNGSLQTAASILGDAGKSSLSDKSSRRRVVIDAGHGGFDPGKIGVNGELEKDINLSIALWLKMFLEANDVEVVLTRQNQEGLYDADASNKKIQDMERRVVLIEQAQPELTVSIHQNSYPESYVHGAQTFYHAESRTGKELASMLQTRLVQDLEPENTRQIKADSSYYLLKHTSCPVVIVECGFLSNEAEARRLADSYFQEKVAWSLHLGILQYLNK